MTLDRHDENPQEDAEHGVLSDAGSLDTAGIGILGTGTAQLRVTLPLGSEDDLDDDDDVVGDEIHIDEIATGDIILEALPADARADSEDVYDAEEVQGEGDGSAEIVASVPDEPASDEFDAQTVVLATDAEVVQVDVAAVVEFDPDAAADVEAETSSDEMSESERAAVSSVAEDDVVDDAESSIHAAVDPAVAPAAVAEADLAEAEPVDVEPEIAQPAVVKPAEPAPARPTPAAPAPATAVAPVTASVPTTRREAHSTGAHQRIDREHASERVTTHEPELVLASKRLGEFDGSRESSDLLTADRLLDPTQLTRPEPEGLWQQLVYSLSGHRINLGDGAKARARKALDRQISAPLPGGARFVPVLSRKGGVGKTTVTALLGMALADARDDRVIAVDANPDRGTLADRISKTSSRTVRDLVRSRADVVGYSDFSGIVARDETRLDVLASDPDPRVSEAFNDVDYREVAVLAAHYYSLVLTDTGTGIVHSVMGATLDLADQLVIVAGLSIDEARLASETLTWLETNGYTQQARDAVVVLNNARPGAPLVRESELEAHFRTRVRSVIRLPYDTAIGTGSAIVFRDLQPATRKAARELAAAVVAGLRAAPDAA